MKVIGIVVLYNPEITEFLKNLESYIQDIEEVLCIDNTEGEKLYVNMLQSINKITYIEFNKNEGLVFALNYGCKYSIEQGYRYAILLDQDSFYAKNAMQKQIEYAKKHNEYSLIAPNIKRIYRNMEGERIFTDELLYKGDVKYVITSGSFIRLCDWSEIGGFDEKLFIGQIDQDYCCNLYANNKKYICLSDIYMYQEAGSGEKKTCLGKTIIVPNYSCKRYYYIFRNEWYLRCKWGGKYDNKFKVGLWKYLILILFEDNKLKKYKSIIAARRNYQRMR